jgi:hypothetical protein
LHARRLQRAWAGAGGALLLLVLWSVDPRWAHAQTPPAAEAHCDGAAVRVRATDREDAATACEGARRALAFLARYGVATDHAIEVELQPQLPSGLRASAVGCYNRRTHRVTVLSYAEFLERGTWFGVPVDRELHRSVVAHEVAHAVVGCQPGAAKLSLPAHEYMAYVATFGTMEPPLRERVLAIYAGAGFDHDAQINSLIHGFDPMRFGASAWQHFRQLADIPAYFRRILAGEILQDEAIFGN